MQETPVWFLGREDPLEKGYPLQYSWASLVAQLVKNPPAIWETWVGKIKIPWRRERLPIPVFWPGEFHRLYSPWGHKELDMTDWLTLLFIEFTVSCVNTNLQHPWEHYLVSKHESESRLVVSDSLRPLDYTVHGILQARILEWVAFPFSRGSSQPRDWTQVSCTAGEFFPSWATREAQEYWSG